MRVLLVVHGYPPDAMGGTEVYTASLARALAKLGDEVTVLAREADPKRPEYALRREVRDGVPIFLVNNTFRSCRSFEETYRNPAIRAIGARVIDRVRPDIALVQHLTCLSTDLVSELAQRRVPVVHTLNDYWLICHRGQLLDMDLEPCPGPAARCERCIGAASGAGRLTYAGAGALRALESWLPTTATRPLRRLAEEVAARLAPTSRMVEAGEERTRHMRSIIARVDLFLSPSDTVLERFADFGVPRERLVRFSYGIERDRFAAVERTPGDRLRIGYLGSLMASKAPHLLLEALAGLPEGAASLELYGGFADYHGDDSYRKKVEPLLEDSRAIHHGPIARSAIPAALARLDVLVVPSIWTENSPLVIHEAFAAGLPVVASNLGGMAEAVTDGVNGLLFEPGDARDLGRVLRRLIDEPDLLERLRSGVPQVLSIEEDARRLRGLCRALVPAERVARPRLAAVVLNYCSSHDAVLALRSLESSSRLVDHIIVIDNASEDDSMEVLRHHLPNVDLHQTDSNLGFSGGCNLGIRRALDRGADLVFLLNADAMVDSQTLARLEDELERDPSVGIIGPLILQRTDPSRVASAGIAFDAWTGRMRHLSFGVERDAPRTTREAQVAAVSGCALLARREVFEQVGMLDEDYFFSFEEIDLCLRAARAGWKTRCLVDAVAYHHGGGSLASGSPLRHYYAGRNHLLMAHRAAPVSRLVAPFRDLLVVALNLAFAVLTPGGGRAARVRAVLRGVWDHTRGRLGRHHE